MKIGKVPENVLKRSILKQIVTKRSEILVGAGVGEDCAVLSIAEDEVLVMSTDPITAASVDMGKLAVTVTANDLASSGAEPIGVMVTLLLNPEITEEEIKTLMSDITEEASKLNIEVMGGHTEITDAVKRPLISITGVGKVKKNNYVVTKGARPGDDVVITKWVGLEGTSIIAYQNENALLERFPEKMIYDAKGFSNYLSIVPEAATATKSGASAMHDVTEGGIFGALWELAESSGVGLEIDLKKIPIKQETIEICNYFDLNPYELISSGSLLIAVSDGNGLVQELRKQGINAVVAGKCTEGNDRVIINGENRRFLEPPKTDEIYRLNKE